MRTALLEESPDHMPSTPQTATVALEPCRRFGVWYYDHVCAELSELRMKVRNREVATHPVLAGNDQEI